MSRVSGKKSAVTISDKVQEVIKEKHKQLEEQKKYRKQKSDINIKEIIIRNFKIIVKFANNETDREHVIEYGYKYYVCSCVGYQTHKRCYHGKVVYDILLEKGYV